MRIFHLTIVLILCSCASFAQDKPRTLKIKQAKAFYTDPSLVDATIVSGDVIIEHENTTMYCDSALMFPKTNSFKAFKNVRLVKGDSLNLRGNQLEYKGNSKYAKVIGNVFLDNKDITLSTDTLNYDMRNNNAYYYSGGVIKSKKNNNRLTSISGRFNSKSEVFFFKDNVVLTNPEYSIKSDTLVYKARTETSHFHGPTNITSKANHIYCEHGWYNSKKQLSSFWKNCFIKTAEQTMRGDSIKYDEKNGIGTAYGNVVIEDSINKIEIHSDYASHVEELDSSIVIGNTLYSQRFDEDTLYLSGDTLILKELEDEKKEIIAFRNVKVLKSDVQAVCDSLTYSEIDSIMSFHGAPILWSDVHQITGKVINIRTDGNNIQQLNIDENSLIVSEIDSVRYNQIKGEKLIGLFNKNDLYKVHVTGSGETVYHMENDKKEYVDINKSSSEEIEILLEDKNIRSIKFLSSPSAKMSPFNQTSREEQLLEGFSWDSQSRPRKVSDLRKG